MKIRSEWEGIGSIRKNISGDGRWIKYKGGRARERCVTQMSEVVSEVCGKSRDSVSTEPLVRVVSVLEIERKEETEGEKEGA